MSRHSFLKRSLIRAYHFSVMIFLLVLTACTKDKDLSPAPVEQPAQPSYETIQPSSSYFPVFPGSWWKYINKDGDTVKYYVESSYRQNTYSVYDYSNPQKAKAVTAYVPFYVEDGNAGIAIWGNKQHIWNTNMYSAPLFTIIDEAAPVGGRWGTCPSRNHITYTSEVLAKDTILTVNGQTYEHVIRVSYWSTWNGLNSTVGEVSDYFAKDVGKIRIEAQGLSLVDYFINK
jgi:hypothetical protein